MRSFRLTITSAVAASFLLACGQGGRELSVRSADQSSGSSSSAQAPQDSSQPSQSGDPSSTSQTNIIVDPLASLLEPTGLGYRVDTVYGNGPDAIVKTGYGIDGLPVGVDVDGDSGTGNILGADISVHFFSLLLYARLDIKTLDGAPSPMPLSVEVSVLDPRNLLGLPGLLGIVDPDLRISLGMDALDESAPGQFTEELIVQDSLFEFLPRFTSASLTTDISEAQGPVAATLSMYADRSGSRADGLLLAAKTIPATSSEINVVLEPDAEQSRVDIRVGTPTAFNISVNSYDGMLDAPIGSRDIKVDLSTLDSSFNLALNGVDGLSSLDDTETTYRIEAATGIETVEISLDDTSEDGQYGQAFIRLDPLPGSLELVDAEDGSVKLETSNPIASLIFAQASNTPIALAEELDPQQPFSRHLIRQYSDQESGREVDLLQLRLGGLESLEAQLDDTTAIRAKLSSAPFELREETPDGFMQASIDMLPDEFELKFPDNENNLVVNYTGSAASPGLSYTEQTTQSSTEASVRPLPAELSLCSASGDLCGSHGDGTDTSIAFKASEPLTLNYRQRSADGEQEVAIDHVKVHYLQVDLAVRSGGKRGYLFFDTDSTGFSGNFRQVDGDNGLAMQFSEGTFAEDRYFEYDDFIFVEERSGTMRCPGRSDLEIRTQGVWIDAGFILDQICQ